MRALNSAVRSSVNRLHSTSNTNDSVILKPDETVLTNRRNTVCSDTVRRLFNLQVAIIYHGFTVVTQLCHGIVSEMWDIHIEF